AVVLPWAARRRGGGHAGAVTLGGTIDARRDRQLLWVSRGLVVAWGVVLTAAAFGVDRYLTAQRAAGRDVPFLDLALGLGSYVTGTLLAAFALAWLPLRRDGYGLIFAAPLSIAMVWASRFHGDVGRFDAPTAAAVVGAVILAAWVVAAWVTSDTQKKLARTGWVVLGGVGLVVMSRYGWFAGPPGQDGLPTRVSVAWPWYAVIGAVTAFVFGVLLGNRRSPTESITRGLPGGGGTPAAGFEPAT
ncbi:MAG: hypothetical protein AAFX76_01820, partial [Planctomycetota bacterium]